MVSLCLDGQVIVFQKAIFIVSKPFCMILRKWLGVKFVFMKKAKLSVIKKVKSCAQGQFKI